MPATPSRRPARPFFLPVGEGARYCLYHPPEDERSARGAILYVPPFAEEMNKSRRMASLQAKAFARMGYGVLLIDLFGCGDSNGEMKDASWNLWKSDLEHGVAWLRQSITGPLYLWGLRLGCLLALDFARTFPGIERVLLWQPVISGEAHLSQFLRLKLGNSVISGGGQAGSGVRQLRDLLATGVTLEIAGYDVAPVLAEAIDTLRIEDLLPSQLAIDWFEVVQEPGRPIPPASRRVLDNWAGAGLDCRTHTAVGPSFWISQEVGECPQLIDKTCSMFTEACL